MNTKFYVQFALVAVMTAIIIALVDASGMLASKWGVIAFVAAIFAVTLLACRQHIRAIKARYAKVIARAQARLAALPMRQQLLAVNHAPAWQAAYRRRVEPTVTTGSFALVGLVTMLVASIV